MLLIIMLLYINLDIHYITFQQNLNNNLYHTPNYNNYFEYYLSILRDLALYKNYHIGVLMYILNLLYVHLKFFKQGTVYIDHPV